MAENPGINPPERLAPHSSDAEEAVIGSILINPDAILEIAAFLQPSDFFIVKNQWVFEAVLAVAQRGESIDTLTVSQELRAAGRLDGIGGTSPHPYLTQTTPEPIPPATSRRYLAGA